MQSGNLAGVMTGQFAFEEDTLRQDVTFILEPLPQMDQYGEEIPGIGEPLSVQVELRAISIY